METLIAYLPALACVAAMLVCFRMMSSHGQSGGAEANEELKELREKVARLEAERTDSITEEARHG